MVKSYGKEQVLSWRFRVGSEIDTRPQHWAATMQQFFDHYQNTVMAIKSVLPDAKVGTHFREATHISNYIDYTGKKEDAYAPHFVAWAKANNVPYDFLAISYYPHITHAHEIDMDTVYKTQIAPILEHPDYNPNASFEIHEYKFIVEMLRAGFVSVETSHNSAFFAMFAKMLLEKNIKEVFQWGNTSSGSYSPEAMTQLALNDMVGNNLHRNQVVGDALFAGNVIDGIFTQRQDHSGFDILTFNFNKNNLAYQAEESIRLSMIVNKPRGTKFQYRMAQIDQTTNIDQLFFTEFPKAVLAESKGGWRKDDAHPTASAINALNETGVSIYHQHKNKYGKINTLNWGAWQKARTTSGNKVDISVIEIKNQLPSFAVQKYQIRW